MERRVTSHTEEEEMNQRRRLLMLARKGDQKAVESLFELYQVRVFSGEALKKKKLPSFPLPPTGPSGRGSGKAGKKMVKIPKVSSLEVLPRTEPAMLPQEPKKKSGLPTKLTGKTKGPKPSAEKPCKKASTCGRRYECKNEKKGTQRYTELAQRTREKNQINLFFSLCDSSVPSV